MAMYWSGAKILNTDIRLILLKIRPYHILIQDQIGYIVAAAGRTSPMPAAQRTEKMPIKVTGTKILDLGLLNVALLNMII